MTVPVHRSRPRPAVIARAVTYPLVAAMVVVAALELEPWPLSSFRLFSSVRTGEAVSWEVAVVGGDGRTTPVSLSRLPPRMRGAHHVLARLAGRPRSEQRRVLLRYLRAAGADDGGVVAVRLYRVVRTVPRGGAPPAIIARRLVVAVRR